MNAIIMTNFLWLYLSHNFTLYCLRLRPIKYVSCIIFHYRSVFKLIARHLFLHFLLFFFFFFFFISMVPGTGRFRDDSRRLTGQRLNEF